MQQMATNMEVNRIAIDNVLGNNNVDGDNDMSNRNRNMSQDETFAMQQQSW